MSQVLLKLNRSWYFITSTQAVKNPSTRAAELVFRRPRTKLLDSLVLFQGYIRLVTGLRGNILLFCKLFPWSRFMRIFWSGYWGVYVIHQASLMRNWSHRSLLNIASGAPLTVTASRRTKSSRKVQSHLGLCRSKSTPLLQSGKAAGEQQRSQSTGVTRCHAEDLSAEIQFKDF